MKKTTFFVFILFLFFIIFLAEASALKLSMADFDAKIFFTPNLYKEVTFTVSEAERIATIPIKLEGELAKYASVTPDELSLRPGESKDFKFTLQLPKELPEGIHHLKVSATEVPVDKPADSSFILMPATGVSIKIINTNIDYDCYIALSNPIMGSNKINVVLNAGNNGNKKIENAYAEFELYDQDKTMLTSWKTNNFDIPSFDSYTLESSAPLNGVLPGTYRLKGALNCAGKKIDLSQQVINHATDLIIHDFRVFKQDNSLKMQFDLENEFDVPIHVYGMVWFYENGKHAGHYALPKKYIDPRSKYTLGKSEHLQGLSIPAGSYDVRGDLKYAGKADSRKATITLTDEDFARAAMEGGFSVTDQQIPEKQKVIIEQPSSFSIDGKMIVRILAALIIIAALILIYRKYFKK